MNIRLGKKNRHFSSGKGFTLVELLVAVLILAVTLTGLLLLFTNSVLLNAASRNLSFATSHGQYVMEGIRQTAFTSILTDINNGKWNWNATSINSGGLTALSNESIASQATGTNPIQVTVTVNWQDRGDKNRNLQLQTLITDY